MAMCYHLCAEIHFAQCSKLTLHYTVWSLKDPYLCLEYNSSKKLDCFLPLTSPKTNMASWKIDTFKRRYIFIHGSFSIIIFVFRGCIYIQYILCIYMSYAPSALNLLFPAQLASLKSDLKWLPRPIPLKTSGKQDVAKHPAA